MGSALGLHGMGVVIGDYWRYGNLSGICHKGASLVLQSPLELGRSCCVKKESLKMSCEKLLSVWHWNEAKNSHQSCVGGCGEGGVGR